jgi:hypothetical protein
MISRFLQALTLIASILIFFSYSELFPQTFTKDPISGKYSLRVNSLPNPHSRGIPESKFDRLKHDKQLDKLKKISKLHSSFVRLRHPLNNGDSISVLKKIIRLPHPDKVMLFGKSTPFYKAPYIVKPEYSNVPSNPLSSNALINGKQHDTISVDDPFSFSFDFAPRAITAEITVYIDFDHNGIVSPGDYQLASGLLFDNSADDINPAIGSYLMKFPEGGIFNSLISNLIFEVNDYHSVSSAILTVVQKPSISVINGALSLPLPNIMVDINNNTNTISVFTDSSGRFSVNIDRLHSNQVYAGTNDILGITNGYVPPADQYLTITSDTTSLPLIYTTAKSFIEGYAKDQHGAVIKNVNISAGGNSFNVTTKTDSSGYYKIGVTPGYWTLFSSINWTPEYLNRDNSYTVVSVSGESTLHQDFTYLKSNSSISGLVTCDGAGVEGIPIHGYSDTLTNYSLSSENGYYSLPVFKPESGSISYTLNAPVPDGYYMITPPQYNIPPDTVNINFEFTKIKGGFEGTVSDIHTGNPIPDATIYFYGNSSRTLKSDESGYYWVNLLDGDYTLSVSADHYHQVYENNITVSGSFVKKNIELLATGSFSGIVKDKSGNPIYNASIFALDSLGYPYNGGYSDSTGHYKIYGLSDYNYKASAKANGFIRQWYNNVSTPDSAALIPVIDGYDTPGINFALSKGGSISGRIVDPLGHPVPSVYVEAYDTMFSSGSWSITDASGFYSVSGLISGKYYLKTYSDDIYVDQWYDGALIPDSAKLVKVVINQDTPNINFTLVKGASITGSVKDYANIPIGAAEIIWCDSLFDYINYTNADGSGNYFIKHLPPNKRYYITANAPGYIYLWYNNVSTPDSATPLFLMPEEQRDNINFKLHTPGSISGRILDQSGMPLQYICVFIQDILDYNSYSSCSDSKGNYLVNNIPPGEYYAVISSYGFQQQWFNHKATKQTADLIKITLDQSIQNINFDLKKPTGDSIIVKLKLNNIPDTLRFSQPYVNNNEIDYWWGVCFDADANSNTGKNGCEVELALIHTKTPSDPEHISNIPDGTSHLLIQWTNSDSVGYTMHSDVDVRIDPADKNSLILAVPKFWDEVYPITSKTMYYAHTYYRSPSGYVNDYTPVGKDMVPITDPIGDVPFNFIDIVSAEWNLKVLEGINPPGNTIPVEFSLDQNYPNPFNPSTTIRYAIPNESRVKIVIYNLLGQEVKQLLYETQKPGYHVVTFNADNIASGIYFYSIAANPLSGRQDFKAVKKMLLLK